MINWVSRAYILDDHSVRATYPVDWVARIEWVMSHMERGLDVTSPILNMSRHTMSHVTHRSVYKFNANVPRHVGLQMTVLVIWLLQCVAVCCSVLQHTAGSCLVVARILQWLVLLQCDAVCCSVWQCAAVCCCVLQCVAVCCNVLQSVAVCCCAARTCRMAFQTNALVMRVCVCACVNVCVFAFVREWERQREGCARDENVLVATKS